MPCYETAEGKPETNRHDRFRLLNYFANEISRHDAGNLERNLLNLLRQDVHKMYDDGIDELMSSTTWGGVRIYFRERPIVPVWFKVCMPYTNLVSCHFF